jgi:hypothetical protein
VSARHRAVVVVIAISTIIAALFLTGCSTFGPLTFSFETDYGRFSYQIPDMPTKTLNDK